MGVYTRYKRDQDGFRKLVELLESTPMSKRERMIDVGMEEDPEFTQKALGYCIAFEDIIALPDMELAEITSACPPRMTGLAIAELGADVKARFLKNTMPKFVQEIKDAMEEKVHMREVGGAKLKLITTARDLERKGHIKLKQIPRIGG
ncbi:MAG: hypothetical protein KA715_05785 [Xanthomonadaceae bacterium]|nr:hypothetical protein [Xanthomonadaceae bacterium]